MTRGKVRHEHDRLAGSGGGLEVAAHGDMSGKTGRRIAQTQALFREVNDPIYQVVGDFGVVEGFSILCECASIECQEQIELTQTEYEHLRPSFPRKKSCARVCFARNWLGVRRAPPLRERGFRPPSSLGRTLRRLARQRGCTRKNLRRPVLEDGRWLVWWGWVERVRHCRSHLLVSRGLLQNLSQRYGWVLPILRICEHDRIAAAQACPFRNKSMPESEGDDPRLDYVVGLPRNNASINSPS
jgi:hypothetical protein